MLQPGIRVVRGPDWIWQNQDDGEGHVGTVCEIGRSGSTHSPEKTVVVNWDSGHRTNYRVGYQGQYDLIVVDNAQIGVKHLNIICDNCTKADIPGIRFRCAVCPNFDLCATCYGDDKHYLDHSFTRYQTANSVGVRVSPREESVKIQLKGIFVGAKVVRGQDWEWGQQDGGLGKTGRVMEIRGWDTESCRSVANVSWVTGSTNVYRLGHKGNVDLKYVQPAKGGYYYKDHMPVLGQTDEQQPVVNATRPQFSVGYRVKVCLDRESLMKLQQGHGGWNPRMTEYLSKIGVVHRITDKGDIRVQYEGCANRWTFHPAALVKVCSFHIGDLVTIITDAAKVQQLQRGHGEWVETMKSALGKTGKVKKVYVDGDLRIEMLENDFAWTLNPKCVVLERSPLATAAERSNSMMDLSHQRTDHIMMPLSGLTGSSVHDRLVREAAQGRLDYVEHFLGLHPDKVDVMSGGKTALQVAAHQGHVNIVRYLLALGANVNVVDREGDSTLHYAAFGNQPEIMKILLQNNADINVLNTSHCSALHISAHKKPPHCVKVLLEFGADVNIQDSYGDTALHDAIGKENNEVVELLCNAPNLNLTVRNNRGFNALHHASLKGNAMAAKKILQMARQLVDVKKDDGFASLHLAALNGHVKVVETLIRDGQADINIRNNRRQTPFLLAVSQGHCAVTEKLVDLGCDILAKDEDGDNAMHLCIIKKANLVQEVSQVDAPKIYEIYQSLTTVTEYKLMYAILCYLIKEGCQIEPNYKGTKIFDWVPILEMKDLILSYEGARPANNQRVQSPTPAQRRHPNPDDAVENSEQINQIYSNIQSLNLNESGDGNASSASTGNEVVNTSLEQQNDMSNSTQPQGNSSGINNTNSNISAAPVSTSNPPTPARRNRNNHNNREMSTPSPSNILHSNNDENSVGENMSVPLPVPKKINTDSPPPLPPLNNRSNTLSPGPPGNDNNGPTTSAGLLNNHELIEITTTNNSPNRIIKETNQNPSPLIFPNMLGKSQNHVSRKQLNNNNNTTTTTTTNSTVNNTPSNTQIVTIQSKEVQECIVCNEITPLIIFEPCYHQISCEDCGIRMKKCLTCQTFIEKRSDTNGRIIYGKEQYRQPSADRLRYLESKILEIEETHCCSICMERRRNVAFLCGHGACSKCADTLKICHMCRKTIVKKINLY